MNHHIIQFLALFLLMLVTGIFWGPLFSLHRSLEVFSETEFIHIVKTMAKNLALPMRIMMPCCILLMTSSACLYPDKNSPGFYLTLAGLGLIIVSLVITLAVEVPIVNQITQWTENTMPSYWESIRERWVKFHLIRTTAALVSFAAFSLAIIFFQ